MIDLIGKLVKTYLLLAYLVPGYWANQSITHRTSVGGLAPQAYRRIFGIFEI